MRKSKIISAIVVAVLGIFGLSLMPNIAHATNICEQPNVSDAVLRANGCEGAGEQTKLSDLIIEIVKGVVGSLAIVAVIFVVVGAINYMTSAGDSGKVQKAKNTILYALIGLIISVLAFAIVNFVIAKVIKSAETTKQTPSEDNSQINGGGGDSQTNGGGGATIQGGGGNK